MSVEQEIQRELHNGESPKSLIAKGYKKSTVYKVYGQLRTFNAQVTRPLWTVDQINFNHKDERYLPGETVTVDFTFNNRSDRPLYVEKIGIRSEWMQEDRWNCNVVQDLLKPDQFLRESIRFHIPSNLPLGEYELFFGVECQYLPVRSQESTQITTTWSIPYILHVKHHHIQSLFLSHSINDKQLVMELDKYLDRHGIKVIIGEDVSQPGTNLDIKFKKLIDSSDLFMAVITGPAIESKWVLMEINHAVSANKPLILLKETSVDINIQQEWIPFSRFTSPESIFHSVASAITTINKRFNIDTNLISTIAIGLLAFLVGWTLSKGYDK